MSYFCKSTELRFIYSTNKNSSSHLLRESDFYHGKSLEIGITFLPSECPLVNHVMTSYKKHYSPSHDTIDEDEEQDEPIKVLRPIKGIDSNKQQPIIRDLSSMTF